VRCEVWCKACGEELSEIRFGRDARHEVCGEVW
jgi:hypothetical protein